MAWSCINRCLDLKGRSPTVCPQVLQRCHIIGTDKSAETLVAGSGTGKEAQGAVLGKLERHGRQIAGK